jgi:hypothetical protein
VFPQCTRIAAMALATMMGATSASVDFGDDLKSALLESEKSLAQLTDPREKDAFPVGCSIFC